MRNTHMAETPALGKYTDMFRAWTERHEKRREEAAAIREATNQARREAKKLRTKEARRKRDRDEKRAMRGKSADTVRSHTDRSQMTDAERIAHNREKERLKKARQRQQAKSDAAYTNNPNFGRF